MRSDLSALVLALSAAAFAAAAQETPAPRPTWASACVAPSRTAPAACFMEQQLALRLGDAAADAAPLALSLRLDVPGPGQPPVMTVRLPFGLDLAAGLRVAVDAGTPRTLGFATCEPSGCVVRAPLTAEEVAAMKAGHAFNLSFNASDGRGLTAAVPLAGFTDTFAAIE